METNIDFVKLLEDIKTKMFLTDAAKRMGISYRTIKAIKNGERVGIIYFSTALKIVNYHKKLFGDQPENRIV
jgi:DNA-binding Xre family transcriptional regulator